MGKHLSIKLNKGFKKAQEKHFEKEAAIKCEIKLPTNVKHKTCYTCREKGYLGKDCPNGENPKLTTVHNNENEIRVSSSDSCAAKINVTTKVSTKAIWIPKSLLTNLDGSNKCWIPKHA